jgi:hypothetical protein
MLNKIIFLAAFSIFGFNNINANEINKITFTSKSITITDITCTSPINENEIIEKEFSNTIFTIDLAKNELIRNINGNLKNYTFKIENGKIIFINCEPCNKSDMTITYKDGSPILKFKDHSDDCFSFTIIF